MAIRKRISNKARATTQPQELQISTFVDSMQSDPRIVSFDVQVNKETGIVRCNARSVDGHSVTKTLLGPGLEEVMRYDPSSTSTSGRDENIRTLLKKGLTQTEVASRLGVSQALVSRVHRST